MTIQITSLGTIISQVPEGVVPALNAHKSREKPLPRGYVSSGIKIGEDNFPLWCNAVTMSIGAKSILQRNSSKRKTSSQAPVSCFKFNFLISFLIIDLSR